MKRIFLLAVAAFFALCVPARAKLLAAVSIAPQAAFLKQIAGDKVDVVVMVPAGADPHTYEPKPQQLAALGKAALYFAIGVDFEKAWLPRFAAANPDMTIVETDAGIKKMPMVAYEHEADEHGQDAHHAAQAGEEQGHHHEAGEPDPHIWLSPRLAKELGSSMRDALAKADPENVGAYMTGYDRFASACDALNADIEKLFADVPPAQRRFMVFHPSWGYFARDFDLTQIPIEQLGREPGPKALAALVREAREDGVKVIFVQPQMSDRQAKTLAQAIGGTVAPLDPLAGDWAANLKRAAAALRQGMTSHAEGK